jgi:predicted RNA-binding protein (virulence factor B family)
MVDIGRMNRLAIARESEFGLLLDGGELGEILLPKRYVPRAWKTEDKLDVFVMRDSEDRLMATMEQPRAMVGEFALLRVKETTRVGAFLDWGMPKDLLVPFREQRLEMRAGQSYLVYIYLDRVSGRIAASSKLDKFLRNSRTTYRQGEKVDLMIWQKTDLGYKAIINGERWGMLFHNEIFQPLERGQCLEGYIKLMRPDGYIDLCLQQPGYGKVTRLTDVILDYLKAQGGFMPVTDKNPPEEIHALFGVSKKTYKKAIGALYKKRMIDFENEGTKLV